MGPGVVDDLEISALPAMTLIGHERDLDEAYVRPGQTQTFRVRLAAGEYVLGCNIHFDMKARMIVDAP
jgi:hypothetical protein